MADSRREDHQGLPRTARLLFAGLQGMAQEEAGKIDVAALRAVEAAQGLAEALPERVREAVLLAVAGAPLPEADLDRDGSREQAAAVTRRVSLAVARAVRRLAEEIQMAVHAERLAALDALHAFAVTSDRLGESLAARAAQAGSTPPPPPGGMTVRLGALWSKDQKAARRYAEKQRIASPSLAFGAGRIAACIAPPAVPAIPSPEPDGLPLTAGVVGWKAACRAALLDRLEPELAAWRTVGEAQLASCVRAGFEALKEEIVARLARSRCQWEGSGEPEGPPGERLEDRNRLAESPARAEEG